MNDKVGNCVDQSHLAVALLRAANIPARYHAKDVGNPTGHCWHEAYFNNGWHAGEATDDVGCPKYDKSKRLREDWINKKAKNGHDKVTSQYNSKFIRYDGSWVKIAEYHLKGDEWAPYYVANFYSQT